MHISRSKESHGRVIHQTCSSGRIEAYSSSFESGKIGPLPVVVMKEEGIDLPTVAPKSVYDRYMEKKFLTTLLPYAMLPQLSSVRYSIPTLTQCMRKKRKDCPGPFRIFCHLKEQMMKKNLQQGRSET